jgi:hypothetical protein
VIVESLRGQDATNSPRSRKRRRFADCGSGAHGQPLAWRAP